jgi:hypothetical protein
MPCDSKPRRRGQTLAERKTDVVVAVSKLAQALAAGRARAKVGPQGAIAFEGWSEQDRDGVTDACAYRRIMVSGSALARAKIAQAEMIAGRAVDRQVVGQGAHSHDGGVTWHDHRG